MPLNPSNWWFFPLITTFLVGMVCPATGTILVTHRRLLQANLISHCVLPGLALATAIGLDPALGGVFSGLIGALVAERLAHKRNDKNEAITNTVLAGSLGLGVLIIPLLGIRVDLEAILFGDLLTVGPTDLFRTLLAGISLLILLVTSYQKLVFIGLDPEGAHASGLKVSSLRMALGFVTALVVVSAMAAVGVVLVIGLLSAPALLSLDESPSLGIAMTRSAIFGLCLALGGFFLAIAFNLSPGPLIGVLCMATLPISKTKIRFLH